MNQSCEATIDDDEERSRDSEGRREEVFLFSMLANYLASGGSLIM
jgi:hypothetical protein